MNENRLVKIPDSFDDSKLPKGKISLERALEIDRILENRFEILKTEVKNLLLKSKKDLTSK